MMSGNNSFGGTMATTVRQVAAGPVTLGRYDSTLECTAGTFTVNLPAVATCSGVTYTIKNSGTGTITVDGDGAETIDGYATQTVPPGSCLVVQSNGTGWIIV
jgi:hypothetical protein